MARAKTKPAEPEVEDLAVNDTTFTEDDLHAISEPVEDDELLADWPTARALPPGVTERPDNDFEQVTEKEVVEATLDVANPFTDTTEVATDPAFIEPSPNPQTPDEVAEVGVKLINDVLPGRGPEPPRQPIIKDDMVLVYDERIQKYVMYPIEQAQYMPRDGQGVPVKERHSPIDEAEHGSPERAVHVQEPGELANNQLEMEPREAPRFSKAARLKAIRQERELLEGQRALTTDIVVLSRVQERLNNLRTEEEALKYAPATIDAPRAYGHQRSRSFTTPVPGGNEQIFFQNHVYVTEHPMEIAALERLIERGDEGVGDDAALVRLEPGQHAYFTRDGAFLGWEHDNSANVKSWLKQDMLRER